MFVSIIIPVYNVERWLERCMRGVLLAAPADSEVILVTGVSSDGSNRMCGEFAEMDSRVQVLSQSGKGLANARNCGVDASKGEYIAYIDSDDYIDAELFAGLLERLRTLNGEAQVVMTDYRMVDPEGKTIEEVFQIGAGKEQARGEEFLTHVLRRKKCFWNVWRYLYRRDFLKRNGICFREGSLSEDMDYTARVFAARPTFAFFHSPFYHYCVGRGDSLMDQPTIKRLRDTVENIRFGVELLDKAALPYSAEFIAQYQFEYILNMALCEEIKRENRTEALALYRETMSVLEVGGYQTAHLVRVALHVLPVRLGALILHKLKIVKRRIRGDRRKPGADMERRTFP